MAFCITQDHVDGPFLAFIGKKNSNFSAKGTRRVPGTVQGQILSYSESAGRVARPQFDRCSIPG